MRARRMTEKDYDAQYDAETLARAEEIKTSFARMKAAKSQAKKMVAEEKKRMDGLQKVVGGKTPMRNNPKKVTPNSRKLSY